MTSELDYAFLAQFVSVQNNSLTAVGASFTRLAIAQVPSQHPIGIGGRVRSTLSSDPVSAEVRIASPNLEFDIGMDFTLDPSEAGNPYGDEDTVGMLFALNVSTPFPSLGLYTVRILIDGSEARKLAFELVPTT